MLHMGFLVSVLLNRLSSQLFRILALIGFDIWYIMSFASFMNAWDKNKFSLSAYGRE